MTTVTATNRQYSLRLALVLKLTKLPTTECLKLSIYAKFLMFKSVIILSPIK